MEDVQDLESTNRMKAAKEASNRGHTAYLLLWKMQVTCYRTHRAGSHPVIINYSVNKRDQIVEGICLVSSVASFWVQPGRVGQLPAALCLLL